MVKIKTKIEERRICYECGQEIKSKYNWKLGITYAARAVTNNVSLCTECVSKRIELDKVLFFEQLINFNIKYKNSLWRGWKQGQVQEFIKILKEKNIPLFVQVPLYYQEINYGYRVPVYLKELLDKNQLSYEIINFFKQKKLYLSQGVVDCSSAKKVK